jgi:hypothetical protein
VSWDRLVLAALAAVAVVALIDAARTGERADRASTREDGLLIDLASSRDGTEIAPAKLRGAFPGPEPSSLAVSKVAAAPDGVVAIAVSYVTGREGARAAVELWHGAELVRSFAVPAGSFSRGLWFAGGGRALAATGWDGTSYVWSRGGRRLRADAYVAYETG